jgi:hypothetical protein
MRGLLRVVLLKLLMGEPTQAPEVLLLLLMRGLLKLLMPEPTNAPAVLLRRLLMVLEPEPTNAPEVLLRRRLLKLLMPEPTSAAAVLLLRRLLLQLVLLLLVHDAMWDAVLDVLCAMYVLMMSVLMLLTWSSSAVLSAADALEADDAVAVMDTMTVQSSLCRSDALFLGFSVLSGLLAGLSSVLEQQSYEAREVRDDPPSFLDTAAPSLPAACLQLSPKAPARSRMELPAEETAGLEWELRNSETCRKEEQSRDRQCKGDIAVTRKD